jgi:GNAT superfamily N-acetyltransferase
MAAAVRGESFCVISRIRQARSAAEFGRLRDLFEQYEADLPPVLRHGAVPGVEELTQAFAGRSAAFLASIGDDDVGCVAVSAFDLQTAQLRHLFVAPRRRGLGAARSLTATAIDFAREQRYARIVLDTDKVQLEPAYLLYRSLGFEECEPFVAVTYESPTFMALNLD